MSNQIWICGDIHGTYDIRKLSTKVWKEQKKMDKSDYLIIAGDVGVCWHGIDYIGVDRDQYIKDIYNKKRFTTLFIDGNHENFQVLNSYPEEEWCGGKVHRISESIIHLMRGQIYNINGTTFFTMGGGYSIDKIYRIPGKSWWKEEIPSIIEKKEGIKNLEKYNYKVDYIITHTCPYSISEQLFSNPEIGEIPLGNYLDIILERVDFRHYFFGHMHIDREINDKITALYQSIVRIV